jgi:hypothetical protein
VAPLITAFVASFVAGSSAGGLCAVRGWANDVRPRRLLREHLAVAQALFAVAGASGVVAVAISAANVETLRWALVLTCLGAGLLFAFAIWVLMVEPDDDGDVDVADEPHWWPEFERDLDAWRRETRTPTSSRS